MFDIGIGIQLLFNLDMIIVFKYVISPDFFKNFFRAYHQSLKQFGSRSVWSDLYPNWLQRFYVT